MILYMSNINILANDFEDIRVRVTGLLGYLSMLSSGDFKDEEIPRISESCKEAIPEIKKKVFGMANEVVNVTNSKLKKKVEENSLRILMKLDHIHGLLKSKNYAASSNKWDEEVLVAKSVIIDLSKINDVIKSE